MSGKGAWTDLGRDKLLSSGLTSAQGERLGMYEVASAATLHPSFDARPALVLPYHGVDKKPLAAHPKWPNFYRIRYLTKAPIDFKRVAGEKEQRYGQPPKSGVCAYLPTLAPWDKIYKDAEYQIILTEGELKAAAACAVEFWTIGLGGVWNFRSSKDGVWFLPELERFNWVQREVFICFDSDYMEKPGVCSAMNALAEELEERGALVKVLLLPEGDGGKKAGLDDYLLEHEPADLSALLEEAEPLGMGRALWRINDDIIYVEDPGLIVVEETTQKLSAEQFKTHSKWATASAVETKVSPKGDLLREKVPAAPLWIRWPLRRSVKRVTYAPGQPHLTEFNEYNQWPGWGVKPVKGDIGPWLELTKYLFNNMERDALDYFYDWCAYPLQNPGTKMFVAVVIHGVFQGTGKTLVGYTLGEIYGKNYKEIKDDDLEESYWAESKQFILGDEVSGKDNRQYQNTLKRLITQRTIDINIKYVPQYMLPNCMNFLFTSQHNDSFFMEDSDRRYYVVEVQDPPLTDEFYRKYDRWLWHEGGASYLMHALLARKISKSFNPTSPAPKTAAKERMIHATKGDLAAWVAEMKYFPDQILRTGQLEHVRDLFTSNEILSIYMSTHPNAIKVTSNGVARALAAAGLPQVSSGNPVMGPDGKMARYFAVRNPDEWRVIKDRKKIEAHLKLEPIRKGKTK